MPAQVDIDFISEQLKKRLKLPLPGAVAHEPMRAVPIGELRPSFTHIVPPKAGSVLILLYPDHGSIKIPLTKRAEYVGVHGGQISFPGGKREAGENDIETALRESKEEVGLDSAKVEVLGMLSSFYLAPSNFVVTPVVAIARDKPTLIPDHKEVVRILECDLFSLIASDAIREKEIIAAQRFKMMAPYFDVEGEVVWGATAMMLNEFRMVMRDLLDTKKER